MKTSANKKAPSPAPVSRSRIVKAAAPTKAKPTAVPASAKSHRSLCPINLTLELVGDSWSLLIIRDMMLRGHCGYQAFLRSEEKIATNILADRLLKLEQNGLISKSPDPADARKFIYALSEKGADLAPLVVELALYGAKHEKRVDLPKEVLGDMQRNKVTFAARLTKNSAPKVRRPARKAAAVEPQEETLSLF